MILNNVKRLLRIKLDDYSQDELLSFIIELVIAKVRTFCNISNDNKEILSNYDFKLLIAQIAADTYLCYDSSDKYQDNNNSNNNNSNCEVTKTIPLNIEYDNQTEFKTGIMIDGSGIHNTDKEEIILTINTLMQKPVIDYTVTINNNEIIIYWLNKDFSLDTNDTGSISYFVPHESTTTKSNNKASENTNISISGNPNPNAEIKSITTGDYKVEYNVVSQNKSYSTNSVSDAINFNLDKYDEELVNYRYIKFY